MHMSPDGGYLIGKQHGTTLTIRLKINTFGLLRRLGSEDKSMESSRELEEATASCIGTSSPNHTSAKQFGLLSTFK